MNVYDFDRTIYDGNCTFDFFLFLLKQDLKLIKYPIQYFIALFLWKIDKRTREYAEEKFYKFLNEIEDVDNQLIKFSEQAKTKIKRIYLNKQQKDDLVISASPYFIVKTICEVVNIKYVIGTNINKKTGEYEQNDCYCFGKQKVVYFKKSFPNKKIEEFYSDSKSDEPLARISKKAYLVKGNKIMDWL